MTATALLPSTTPTTRKRSSSSRKRSGPAHPPASSPFPTSLCSLCATARSPVCATTSTSRQQQTPWDAICRRHLRAGMGMPAGMGVPAGMGMPAGMGGLAGMGELARMACRPASGFPAALAALLRARQRDGVGGLLDPYGREAEDPVLAGHVWQGPDALILQPDLPATGGREPFGVAVGYLLVALNEILHALLAAREGIAMVAVRVAQLAGQDVGPDQGEAASLAGQRRWAVASVADEGDPPGRPGVHADLANRVKVEVRGLPHGREQPGDLPAVPGESGGEEVLLLATVAVVVIERLGTEEEDRPRLAIASRAG